MARLDFLVIGAQKAGTTTLWELLRGHPELALPEAKEAPFFSDEQRWARGLEWYVERFFAPSDTGLRGTVTPQYMTGRAADAQGSTVAVEKIAERIAVTLPDGKLIALLRDPIARAGSHYRMSFRHGIERRPLATALVQQLHPAALRAGRRPPIADLAGPARGRALATCAYLAWSEYGRILRAFRRHFTPEQLLILLTDDLERDPRGTLRRTFAYLGVDPAFEPEDPHVRRMVGGGDTRLDQPDLEELVQRLHEAVPEVEPGSFEVLLTEWNTLPDAEHEQLPRSLQGRLRDHFAADAKLLGEDWGVQVPWAADAPAEPRFPPASEPPDTSVIVLVHETPAEAETVLNSIASHTGGRYEVLLVDNGSSPAVAARLADLAGRFGARLVRNDANLVFSIAMNRAAKIARAPELLLLNSDVVVTPNWLATLRDALHSAPDIAAVGPRSNYMRSRQGGIWLEDSSMAGIEWFGSRFNYPDPKRRFEIDWLSGFALLVRRDVFEALGGLDEDIPWYGLEDLDFGERLWAAGHRVLCCGDVFVYHTGHRTFSNTGTNRTATRLGRTASTVPAGAHDEARFVRERGLVFEVRDGVASHAETPHVVALLRGERDIEDVEDGALDGVPVGPPLTLCRVRETDEVWLLHGSVRRRVTGDPQRIRRLAGVSMAEPGELGAWVPGPEVDVSAAVAAIPELVTLLPRNPATIVPDELLDLASVRERIAGALADDAPLALLGLGIDEARLLAAGVWPAEPPALDRLGAGDQLGVAAAELRRAVADADILAVETSRLFPDGAPLLEQLLFHFEVYPRARCADATAAELLGYDPCTRVRIALRGSVQELLHERPVAVVAPEALLDSIRQDSRQLAAGFQVSLAVGLDDLREVDRVLSVLAAQRESYDAVLIGAMVPGKILAARVARELGVVALEFGITLGRLLHPRFARATVPVATARWEARRYLELVASGTTDREPAHDEHPLNGRLVRAAGRRGAFYVERGAARAVASPELLADRLGSAIEVSGEDLDALPRGPRVSIVHERLTGPYVLLDGRPIPVDLGLDVVEVGDLALAALPEGAGPLTRRTGR